MALTDTSAGSRTARTSTTATTAPAPTTTANVGATTTTTRISQLKVARVLPDAHADVPKDFNGVRSVAKAG